jgi:hypothetical protein
MKPWFWLILLLSGGLLMGTAQRPFPTVLVAGEAPSPTYVGAAACAPCHREQVADWEKSAHARAWASLEADGKTNDAECVSCHVTGPLAEGDAPAAERAVHKNVQCEVCHGPGSVHVRLNFILTRDGPRPTINLHEGRYEPICLRCHDKKHSLDFRFARDVKRVNHAPEPFEPNRWTEETTYVGSAACLPCHTAEYEQWAGTKHAAAFAALQPPAERRDPRCLPCHTTGYDQKQGFVSEADTPKLVGVGCETCHGPGGDHVDAPPEKKEETIYGLGSRCASCAIRKLCHRCHTPSRDPDFTAHFEEAMKRVKHR